MLRKILNIVHKTLVEKNIEHALIGGLALATLGINRATADVDMLIDKNDIENAKIALIKVGFELVYESEEVIHFSGIGELDFLIAKRPLSRKMLMDAKTFPQHGIKCLSPEDIIGLKIQSYINDKSRELQDKADIRALMVKYPNLDINKIKIYAELFDEWNTIKSIKD